MAYIIRSRYNFWINDISASSVGLVMEMPDPVPMAKQRYTVWTSGDTDNSSPDNTFEDIEYTFIARRFKTPDNFLSTDIYKLFAEARTLRISQNPNRYYKIKRVVNIVPSAAHHGNEITYRITLALSPFAYHTDNSQTLVVNNQIENPGTRYSRPIYKFAHAQNTTTFLSVNGQVLEINYQAATPIIIDCERMIAMSESGVNQTQYTAGQFPFLSPGTNLLSAYYGEMTQVDLYVTGNWRDY